MDYVYKTSEYECVAPEKSEVAPYDPYDPCDLPEYCTGSSSACDIVKDNRCGFMLPYERSICGRSMHCPIHVQHVTLIRANLRSMLWFPGRYRRSTTCRPCAHT